MSRSKSKTKQSEVLANSGKASRSARPTILLGLYGAVHSAAQDGVVAMAQEYGWHLVNLSCFEGFLPSYINPQGVLDEHIAGASEVENLRAQGCPVVRLGRLPHPEDHLLPALLPDYATAGRLAATHLAERGFKELGYVGYHKNEVAEILLESFYHLISRNAQYIRVLFLPARYLSHFRLNRARVLDNHLFGPERRKTPYLIPPK